MNRITKATEIEDGWSFFVLLVREGFDKLNQSTKAWSLFFSPYHRSASGRSLLDDR